MKKNKIISAFAALAVAVSSIAAPVKTGIGLGIEASAEPVIGGTLTASAPYGSTVDLDALVEDDEFYVQVWLGTGTVTQKLDTFYLEINYNASAFELEQWYYTPGEERDGFLTIDGVINGATSATANAIVNGNTGTLYASASGTDNGGAKQTIDLSTGLSLLAKFKTISNVGGEYTFSLQNYDFSYVDEGADPDSKDDDEYITVWEPWQKQKTVHISNAISGTIDGCTLADGENLTVSLKESDGTVADTYISSDGTFVFKNVSVGTAYTIEIDRWCEYTNQNYKVTGSTSQQKDKTVSVRLYGDVHKDGVVDAQDATQVLRNIVGNTNEIDQGSTTERALNLKVANVLTTTSEEALNARDATQILRYVCGYTSTFDDRV